MVLDERCVDLLSACNPRAQLTFNAPISFTMTAHRRPWSLLLRMYERRVVFPLPKKPDKSVTGSRVSFSSTSIVISLGYDGFERMESVDMMKEDRKQQLSRPAKTTGPDGTRV